MKITIYFTILFKRPLSFLASVFLKISENWVKQKQFDTVNALIYSYILGIYFPSKTKCFKVKFKRSKYQITIDFEHGIFHSWRIEGLLIYEEYFLSTYRDRAIKSFLFPNKMQKNHNTIQNNHITHVTSLTYQHYHQVRLLTVRYLLFCGSVLNYRPSLHKKLNIYHPY